MRRYHSHFSRREAEIWPYSGQVEPQQKVFAVPPISVGGGLYDIHPMRRGGVKSFVDDLVLGRGVVPSRAATSLRSVETQPLTRRFVRTRRATSPFSLERGLAVVLLGLLALLLMYIFFSSLSVFSVSSLLFSYPHFLEGNRETPSLAAWGGAGTAIQTAGQQFERWCDSPFSSSSSSVKLMKTDTSFSIPVPQLCCDLNSCLGLVAWGRWVRDWFQFSKFFSPSIMRCLHGQCCGLCQFFSPL